MIYITRRERFNAAHMLWNYSWSDQKNFEVFGKCANKNWHGHNFELFVTVKGEVNEDTGFVVNLKDLAKIIKEKGLKQQSDPKELEKIVIKVLNNNSNKVSEYKKGKEKLYGFFVGEIMKATSGKANPLLINNILKEKLKK